MRLLIVARVLYPHNALFVQSISCGAGHRGMEELTASWADRGSRWPSRAGGFNGAFLSLFHFHWRPSLSGLELHYDEHALVLERRRSLLCAFRVLDLRNP